MQIREKLANDIMAASKLKLANSLEGLASDVALAGPALTKRSMLPKLLAGGAGLLALKAYNNPEQLKLIQAIFSADGPIT